MNKNQKYTLNLSIEDNEELNKAIDVMIRARVQNIIRQESESFLEQEIVKNAKACIASKAETLTESTVERWARQILREGIITTMTFNRVISEYIREHYDDFIVRIDAVITRAVNEKLSQVIPTDVVKIVAEALLPKKEPE